MRLIRGAPGAGKTALVFREFREALKAGRANLRIVVPTATLVRHFQHELARDGAVFPPSAVVSLHRFIEQQAPDLKTAPDGLRRAIVRDTLRRLKPAAFAEAAQTEGMIDTLLDTITLFENAGATPGKLAALSRRLTPCGRAFLDIWKSAAALIAERGFASRTELTRAAAAAAGGLRIWMDGFVSFSPLEAELVGALAAHCDLTLTLTDTPAHDEIRLLAMRLKAEDKLLSAPPRRPAPAAFEAASIEREADEIARRIVSLNESGTPLREIGVALRDPASYLPLLRCVFDRFGIPAHNYFTSPLRHHPAAVFLGGLIVNTLDGWEFGAALDCLRAHPGWGAHSNADWFDFKVREAMPGRGPDNLLSLCGDEILRNRLTRCFEIAPWRDEKHTPSEWARRFEHLAETLYRPGRLAAPVGHAEIETQRSHVAAAAAWSEAAVSVEPFWTDANAAIPLGDFWRAASDAVAAAGVRMHDHRLEAVHVMSAHEARQWDVSALFVCGFTDRDYPRKHPDNALFPDRDIEALRKAGIPLRRASDLDRDEEALFDALRARATDSLVVSWPAHDASGKRAQSSRHLTTWKIAPETARLCRPAARVEAENTGVAGRLDSPHAISALAERHRRIGLTSLEDLAQCRFKFFAGRTLGLKSRPERPEERLQPRVTGLILHETLELWLNGNRQGDFAQLFETAFENAVRERHLPPGYRLEVERMALRNVAARVSATERWKPLSSEAEVEVTIEFPGGITVAGRIDRLDRMSGRDCIIVDYKAKKVAGVERLVESSTALQGPLYALGVRETRGLNTIAMMYHAVRDDRRFGWGEVPDADLDLKPMPSDWIESAKNRAVERLGDFLTGAIHADPTERDQCRWCDFAGACRYAGGEGLAAGA